MSIALTQTNDAASLAIVTIENGARPDITHLPVASCVVQLNQLQKS